MFQHRFIQKFSQLTETEQYICQQLIQMQNNIKPCGIVALSQQCHTSTSTLFRTIQSLGYDGYAEFRYDFFQKNSEQEDKVQTNIQDIWDIIHKTEAILTDIEHISIPKAEKQTIYICGSGVIQRQAGRELARQLKGSRYVIEIISDQYELEKIQTRIHKDDIAIFISLSGENKTLLEMIPTFLVASAFTITICLNSVNTLGKLSHFTVPYEMSAEHETIIPLYMTIEYVAVLLKTM